MKFMLDLTHVSEIDVSMASGDGVFALPEIGKKSPFKGFLDISIVTQKLRKSRRSQDGGTPDNAVTSFEFGGKASASPMRSRRLSSSKKPVKATAEALPPTAEALAKVQPKGTRF